MTQIYPSAPPDLDGAAPAAEPVDARAPITPPRTPRVYLALMVLLVAIGTAIVTRALLQAPMAPGVDPGHWLAISYSYVGLPTAPDPTDRILFYPPLLFPILGGLTVLAGPLAAADIVAAGLFLAFGLSVVHLARRFLVAGPFQVALVGLAVFSGPTLQMVFWGGYPNLLGFVLMNEAFVCVLLFVRRPTAMNSVGLYGMAALTFLAHDLSFAVLLVGMALAAGLLVLFRSIPKGFLLRKANLLGVSILVGTVLVYLAIGTALNIPHPDYLKANPSAYFVDQIGELFLPLAHNPIIPIQGPGVFLPSVTLAFLMVVAPIVAIVSLRLAKSWSPRSVDPPILIGAGWLSGAAALPGLGYLTHIDTDYTRFLYFLPLPFFLVGLVGLERATASSWVAAPWVERRGVREDGTGLWNPRTDRRYRSVVPWVASGAVSVIVLLVLIGVAIPVVQANENAASATAHDQPFLDVEHWLRSAPGAGNVLTVASAARWTEALSLRDAFTVGPVWLLFDPFQITDAQESYWALSAKDTLSNNQVALSFSGSASTTFSQAPMYTAYLDGVPFPVLRILPGSVSITGSNPTGTDTYSCTGSTSPAMTANAVPFASVTLTYQCGIAMLVETGRVPSEGPATVHFSVLPSPGAVVRSISIEIGPPPSDSPLLGTDQPSGISFHHGALYWNVSGKLGQYPERVTIDSRAVFTPDPSTARLAPYSSPNLWNLTFADPNGSSPFGIGISLTSEGTSNPSSPLPPLFDSLEFLRLHDIRYLLWPAISHSSSELSFFSATFGFHTAFANSEWTVLESP